MRKRQLFIPAMLLMFCVTALPQEGRYLPDFTGKVTLPLDLRDPAQYHLSAVETSALRQNLQRLKDLLLAQPALNPPRGVEFNGDIRIAWTSLCPEPPCPNVSVASNLHARFLEYFEYNGKPALPNEAEAVMDLHINDPEETLGSSNLAASMKNLKGRWVFFQLPKIGEIQGYPLYRNYPDNLNILILTKSPKPYWLPLTQEEFLQMKIRDTEEELAKMAKVSHDPAGDAYRQWVAGQPERNKIHREVYEQTKKTNPQWAEKSLEESEKTEATVTEGLRKYMEKNPPQARSYLELAFERRLARHKAVLASMTPGQRQAQVRYFPSRDPIEPDLLPLDSELGTPLVIANPNFMNRSLPPTAIQLIAVFFRYGPHFDPTNKDEGRDENPANLRLLEMEQKSNWTAISSILSGP
jgi:hypothetical protein